MIQKLRLLRGWSQEQLATLSGLSVRTIQRIERGQKASAESYKALASVFELDYSTLQESGMDIQFDGKISNQEFFAFQHVRAKKGFYFHLIQYVLVVGSSLAVNVWLTPKHWWVQWMVIWWTPWLLFHGLRVFNLIPFLDTKWEKREVEKYLGHHL